MAVAAIPRMRASQEHPRTASGDQHQPWRRLRLVAIALLGLLLLTIPTGLVVGDVLTQNAHQMVLHLEGDLSRAVDEGVDPREVQPLEDRLQAIAPPGPWEDPVTAERQLRQLAQLHNDLAGLAARTLKAERDAFSRSERAWQDLATQARGAGLSLAGLSAPVGRLRDMAGSARTPIAVRNVTAALATYISALSDRLASFTANKANAQGLLVQAQAQLQSAGQYRELKLVDFQGQLAAAGRDIAAVHTPDGFTAVVNRIQQTQTAIKSLLSARQGAYAELAASRAALASAASAGVDVSGYAAKIETLAGQLATAGDQATFSGITAQLEQQRQAVNGLVIVTIPAPIYQQAMALDCETSALRVGLAFYGHYYSDAQLFSAEPVDLRAPVMGPNHTIAQWGNPYVAFVGNVNGAIAIPTGYGVYYPVIVSLARNHGLPNAAGGEGYSASTIYAELRAHHPVEVWVEYNWGSYQHGVWTAWDGTRVRYSYGEHAVTLTGVSPTQVRVNDVGHGTQYWIDKSTFEVSWSVLNDMAVIFK